VLGGFEMTAEKLNAWLTLGANMGVVLGLAILIYEINQNTEMMQAQMNQSRTDTALSEQQAIYNSDYMPAIDLKVRSGEQLSDEELIRFKHSFRAFNRNMDNQLWQHNHGYLGENIPYSIRRAVRYEIGGSSLGLTTWDESKRIYTKTYVAFVEEAIAELR
jgi:hypothetical protein